MRQEEIRDLLFDFMAWFRKKGYIPPDDWNEDPEFIEHYLQSKKLKLENEL